MYDDREMQRDGLFDFDAIDFFESKFCFSLQKIRNANAKLKTFQNKYHFYVATAVGVHRMHTFHRNWVEQNNNDEMKNMRFAMTISKRLRMFSNIVIHDFITENGFRQNPFGRHHHRFLTWRTFANANLKSKKLCIFLVEHMNQIEWNERTNERKKSKS